MAANTMFTRAMRRRKTKVEPDLFKLFHKVGNHLTKNEVNLLTILSGRQIDESLKGRIKNGRDFFTALVKSGTCDESEFSSILDLLRKIKRHDLLHMFHVREVTKVPSDPIEDYFANKEYLQQHSYVSHNTSLLPPRLGPGYCVCEVEASTSTASEPPRKKTRRSLQAKSADRTSSTGNNYYMSPWALKKLSYTCDVRLRVSAEFSDYQAVLQDIEPSDFLDPPDRQAECFYRAFNHLQTRDLGYIICDIKFSEITYLDAFWRDYLSGALLDALRGVFITDSMKQQSSEEETIKLLVNVDEDDYERGRLLLMKNLEE